MLLVAIILFAFLSFVVFPYLIKRETTVAVKRFDLPTGSVDLTKKPVNPEPVKPVAVKPVETKVTHTTVTHVVTPTVVPIYVPEPVVVIDDSPSLLEMAAYAAIDSIIDTPVVYDTPVIDTYVDTSYVDNSCSFDSSSYDSSSYDSCSYDSSSSFDSSW